MREQRTAHWYITTRREMAHECIAALEEAERNGGPWARIENSTYAFDNLFTAGLALWRSGHSPAQDFERALEVVDAVLSYIRTRSEPCNVFIATPSPLACLMSYLLSGALPPRYLDTLPSPAALPKLHRKLHDMNYLLCLVWALNVRSIPAEAYAIADAPMPKRSRLTQEAFRAHLQLLQDILTGAACDVSLHSSEALYDRRARSGYYEGGADYWGGGPMNPFMLDFETAAILRLGELLGRTIPPTIHRWRWAA